jgi:hypothetical protein
VTVFTVFYIFFPFLKKLFQAPDCGWADPPNALQILKIGKFAIFLAVFHDTLSQTGTDSRQCLPIAGLHGIGSKWNPKRYPLSCVDKKPRQNALLRFR